MTQDKPTKTAMMELIEYINYIKQSEGILTSHEIKEKAFELLEKEKTQIVDAYIEGVADLQERYNSGEDYFNQTYKQ